MNLPLLTKDKVNDEDVGETLKSILFEMPIINELEFDNEDVFVSGKII